MNIKALKECIKEILRDYPRLFILGRFLRWLPKNTASFLKIKCNRILHFREIVNADIVLSVGNHCQAAYYMGEYGLRKFASPLDWMKYYSLDTVIKLFKNDFKDFFVNYYEDTIKAQNNGNCRWLVDKNTGMIARHHFLKEKPLKEQMDTFYQQQLKRFARMRKYLQSSHKIALVSCREDSLDDLKKFLFEFWELYGGEITLVNFRDSKKDEYKKIIKINENLKIIEYCFDNTYPESKIPKNNKGIVWIGNYLKWGGGMSLIKLTNDINYPKKENLNDRY